MNAAQARDEKRSFVIVSALLSSAGSGLVPFEPATEQQEES
jgi:hypothetical protein